jgi:hypothetical protein
MRRRQAILLAAASLVLSSVLALAAGPPSRPAGAWHPSGELTLAGPDEPGEPFVIEGRVLSDADSVPLRGVRLHAYHADNPGYYGGGPGGPARIAGNLVSGEHGFFRIRTVLPGMAEGTPHVHFEIYNASGGKTGAFTLNLCRVHGAGSDANFERIPYFPSVPASRDPGYWAKVERAADRGFICRWDAPVPYTLGTPSR